MSPNATHKSRKKETPNLALENFLKCGLIMGLGPAKCLIAWGDQKFAEKPTGDTLEFFVPDFYLEDSKPWVTFEHTLTLERSELLEKLSGLAQAPHLDLAWQMPAFDDFKGKFELVQSAIKTGEIRKAVPVVFEHSIGTMTMSMRANILRNLLQNAVKPHPYGFWDATRGIMGATPEILFSFNAKTSELETMALAGTRETTIEAVNSLEKDAKEMFEHDLVVQGLREKLTTLGDLKVSPTYVWDLGLISHLRTDFTVELGRAHKADKIFTEICALLHPTAALGVSPNKADWRFLRKCDGAEQRGFFGAPFGVLNPAGKSVVLVAIRNIQWREDRLLLGTGCGVVAQSELPNEWQELEVKRRAVHALLGL